MSTIEKEKLPRMEEIVLLEVKNTQTYVVFAKGLEEKDNPRYTAAMSLKKKGYLESLDKEGFPDMLKASEKGKEYCRSTLEETEDSLKHVNPEEITVLH